MARTKNSNDKKNPFRCTSCKKNIKTSFDASLHPLLQVLVCRTCYLSYPIDGDFSTLNDPEVGPGVDDQGYDNYCRWCVDGGSLYECSTKPRGDPTNCRYAYCSECIKRNCPEDFLTSVINSDTENMEELKWLCFACDPTKLQKLRAEAAEAILTLSKRDLRRATPGPEVGSTPSAKKTKPSSTSEVPAKEPEASAIPPSTKKSKPTPPSEAPTKEPEATVPPSAKKGRPSSTSEAPSKEQEATSAPPSSAKKIKPSSTSEAPSKELEVVAGPASVKKSKPSSTSESNSKEQEPSTIPTSAKKSKQPSSDTPSKEPDIGSMPPSTKKSKLTSTPEVPPKEPEASSIPPLEKPRQPVTSLRKLSEKQQFIPGLTHKPKPLSKQLKPVKEQVNSVKIPLGPREFKAKLEFFTKIKSNCISELESKFPLIISMIEKRDANYDAIVRSKIDDLARPMDEFVTMLSDLKSLLPDNHGSENSLDDLKKKIDLS